MTGRTVRFVGVAALVLALAAMAGSHLFAQGPAPEGPPPTPRALTPQSLDLEGYWVSIINEDYRWRMVTPPPGDFASLPLNQAGREMGEQWTPDQDGSCLAYGMAGLMRMPTRVHLTWVNDETLQIETDAGQQTRMLYFDASEAPTTSSLQGRSVAEWDPPAGGRGGGRGRGRGGPPPPPTAAEFGTLKVMTSNLTGGWIRRNGAPYSDQATVEEYFDNFDSTDDSKWLIVTTIVRDPMYINGDYITSSHFRREAGPDGPAPANWDPTPCRPVS